MSRKIKFGVLADLHVDIMHDTQERLEKFLEASRKADVDFIIQLGDFCYPDDNRVCVCPPEFMPANVKNALEKITYADKDAIINMYNNFEKPSFHVLGNHECDVCSKKDTIKFLGMNNDTYYSFDMGGFHFVVLDANFYRKNGEYIAFEKGNYFAESRSSNHPDKESLLPWLPPEQIEWLKNDLAKTKFPSILFSHQCLGEEEVAGLLNAKAVKEALENAPCGVVAAFYGHIHREYQMYQDGIWFISINSMSCCWVGTKHMCEGIYGEEIDEKYPNIKYTVPYKDSLYAIIEIDEECINIKGVQSECVGPSLEERGLVNSGSYWDKYAPLTAQIEDRCIKLNKCKGL